MVLIKSVFLLLALLFTVSFTQNCIGSQSDDLVQSGIKFFYLGIVQIFNPLSSNSAFAQTLINYAIPSTGFTVALCNSHL
jgi:hypothetical protein